MTRVFNFSAGPAVLPEGVLRDAAREMLDYQGCGMSVMEMSHRSSLFKTIIQAAEADLRDLMGIPDSYRVLFLQGGGSLQFAMVPLNLMKSGCADYLVSGSWSQAALAEAQRFGDARAIASTRDQNFTCLPDLTSLKVRPQADYLYLCQNETVYGTTYHELPDTQDTPLVADLSSIFLSEPVDVERYGLIFAGAQKNAGPAGVTVVIIRDDLIPEKDLAGVPTMLQYRTHAKAASLYNTPPCYAIYLCGKVFAWIKEQGGLAAMQERNRVKADVLYTYLDESDLFSGIARCQDRSLMNVPFTTGDATINTRFIEEARAAGLVNLAGHRSVGGMRASLYNAMPLEGVQALVSFMQAFEASQLCSSRSMSGE